MTKIYEALQRAAKEKQKPGSSLDLLAVNVDTKPAKLDMEEEMLSLYQAISSLMPATERKIIQFVGSRKGEGTSTVVREFAKLAAMRMNKSVFLLDADRTSPSQHLYFDVHCEHGWQDAVNNPDLLAKAMQQVENYGLFVGPSCNTYHSTPQIFDSNRLKEFWQSLWTRFDLILIDSPPFSLSPDGLAIAPRVDGVVLVVEAEKTPWPVVESVHKRIRNIGGHVLGIVFNKRRYYIPQFLYNLL